jgi:hypothetical protein
MRIKRKRIKNQSSRKISQRAYFGKGVFFQARSTICKTKCSVWSIKKAWVGNRQGKIQKRKHMLETT